MSDMMRDITAIAMAVIGLAMLAVVIKSQNTSSILNSSFSGFGNLLTSASKG
jgi:hypothetical protein